ncbi:MAG: CopG family transcriptional regulator [Planctomycetes bacterium]|nr:CopG family transcriptional regulator [Planctomycetota bacterium]MBI3832993.1 CopG family transcriptional regulator [Planctomycetota bacterium]
MECPLEDKPKRVANSVTLKIPAELYQTLTKLIEGTGFRSVTEFAVHVLRDVAAGGKLQQSETGFTAREVEIIRERLKALGYLE